MRKFQAIPCLISKRTQWRYFSGNAHIEGILPKGPYPPWLRMADRALLAGNPRYIYDIKQTFNRTIYSFWIIWCYHQAGFFTSHMLYGLHKNIFEIYYQKVYSLRLVSPTSLQSAEVACSGAWNEIDQTAITQPDTGFVGTTCRHTSKSRNN